MQISLRRERGFRTGQARAEGLVNSRLGLHVGRLADDLRQQDAFAFILAQHRGKREAFGRRATRGRFGAEG